MQQRRSNGGRQCRNAGGSLESQSPESRSERKSEKKEVSRRIKFFQKNYMKWGSRSCYERERYQQGRG